MIQKLHQYDPWAAGDLRGILSRLLMCLFLAGLTGTVVKDPVQDRIVWQEYLETVVKERDGWKDLYRACREAASVLREGK